MLSLFPFSAEVNVKLVEVVNQLNSKVEELQKAITRIECREGTSSNRTGNDVVEKYYPTFSTMYEFMEFCHEQQEKPARQKLVSFTCL